MKKLTLIVTALAVLLWVGRALAAPTAQQNCDYARITAWKKYTACIENVVAKDAKGLVFDEFAASARCRHTYFGKWTGFQAKAPLAGSTCIGSRFTDNGDQTVTDNLSGLVWEKKDLSGGVHDLANDYSWSTGPPYVENGTAFTNFLVALNTGGGFAGANGWRLPTLAELQTIVLDFPCRGAGQGPGCSCPVTMNVPCIDPALGYAFGTFYWSTTSYTPSPNLAWYVEFSNGIPQAGYGKIYGSLVRAVRGGL